MRDSQLSRVWAAERDIHTPAIVNRDEAVLYAQKVAGSAWFRRRRAVPARTISVVPQDSSYCNARLSMIGARTEVISLPWKGKKQRHQVLHALAHVLTPPDAQNAWHGPRFAKTYLEMVDRFLPEASADLRVAFKARKVKSRVVVLSDEEKAARAERLRKMREAKLDEKAEALEGGLRALLAKVKGT